MNKSSLILAGGAFLASAFIFGQAIAQNQSDSGSAAPAPKSDVAAVARGAEAWANACGRCHNLRSPSELNAELWDVSVQHMRVRANIPGSVADDIKLFLMSSAASGAKTSGGAPNDAPLASFANLRPGDSVRGKEVYSQTCFVCHGADGKGAIDGVPDLAAKNGRLTKTNDIVLSHMIDGFQSDGAIMAMPPKGGNPDLTDQDMVDVLAYMRKEYGIAAKTEQ